MATRYSKDMNVLVLSGRAVDAPGMRTVPNGKVHVSQAVFRLCCSRGYDDAGVELCEFFTVICSGPTANEAEKHVRKGTRLYISGSIRAQSSEGPGKTRRDSWYIAASQIKIIDRDYDPAESTQPDPGVDTQPIDDGLAYFGAQLSMGGLK